VLFVTNDELKNQVPLHLIPENLGGLHKLNHQHWLNECNKLITNRASTSSSYYFFSSTASTGSSGGSCSSSTSSGVSSSKSSDSKQHIADESEVIVTTTEALVVLQQQHGSEVNKNKRPLPGDSPEEEKQLKKQPNIYDNIQPVPFDDV
jgi:hypothetical protein